MAHSSKQMHIMITNILSFHFYSDTSAYIHFFNVFFIIFNEDYPALSGQLSHFPLPVDQLAFPCLFLLSHVWRHERKGKQETGNGSTEASDHITVLSPSLWAMSSHWWATINMPRRQSGENEQISPGVTFTTTLIRVAPINNWFI